MNTPYEDVTALDPDWEAVPSALHALDGHTFTTASEDGTGEAVAVMVIAPSLFTRRHLDHPPPLNAA